MSETWYLLFDGESMDGRGNGEFSGRTKSKDEALRHNEKCWSNPYSIGYVIVVTDSDYYRMPRVN